jgi:AsmA protein
MNKAIKWFLIVGAVLVALIIASLLVIPMFVDIQKYKPEIEKRISQTTGRPFAIGGDLSLSLFPWAGISFSDLHLGNPPGFEGKDFLSVKFFEARVKIIPLMFKEVHVNRFILEGPRIVLERSKSGRGNWEGLGKVPDKIPSTPPRQEGVVPEKKPRGAIPIETMTVGKFAVTKGSLVWIDRIKKERKEISDIDLHLQDVSFDRPIRLQLSASLDGHPLELKARVGPVGKEPGKGALPLELEARALRTLVAELKGQITDAATRQEFDLAVQVSPFSPRKLAGRLGKDLPVKTADPKCLNTLSLKARLKGNPKAVSISDGMLELDDSKLSFSLRAKDFSRPNLAIDLSLDKIDLDRYLPPAEKKKTDSKKTEHQPPAPEGKKTDFTPLRKLILESTIRVGELKARGARVKDLLLKVSAKDGLFRLDPLTAKLYQGDISSRGALDLRQDILKSRMEIQAKGIQVNPLLKDLLKKDFLEGTIKARLNVASEGDLPDKIKSTLNGDGKFLFVDGAIVGIDLAGMARNIGTAFGISEKGGKRPRTDFSELDCPFTIKGGVVDTRETKLASPFLRVHAAGKVDLVRETLDLRVEPKFVVSLKGQGDAKERAGLTVPVLVTGTFSSPKFRPDLETLLKKRLEKEMRVPSKLKKMLPDGASDKGESRPLEKKAKELLKDLPFGR